jgi:hypothetical protein
MKKLILILSLLVFCLASAHSQTMQVKNGKLYYGDLRINLSKAKELATSKNNVEALEQFTRSAKMKRWDLVWAIIGGADMGEGIVSLSNGRPGRFLFQEVAGAAFLYLVYKREKQANLYLNKGVDLFNGNSKM